MSERRMPWQMSVLRWALSRATQGICRVLGRFPARALRMGPEDEAALVLGEWMAWNTNGRRVGADGFDYLAALCRVRTPSLLVAGAWGTAGCCSTGTHRAAGPS